MAILKERTKGALRALGLYEPGRKLWARRPDLRLLCWNAGYRLAGAGDGLPIPSTHLIYLVAGSREISWFLQSSYIGSQSILRVLQDNGIRMEDFGCVLDFGCGCGRIIRKWHSLSGPCLYGTDYNPDLIRWCQRKLGNLAEFKTNGLSPPLDYEEEMFEFIYAISVFTHLTEDLQVAWMNELARVLKPGGLLLITTHGESRFYELGPEQLRRFQSGQLVVKEEWAAGANICCAYHPERYVRDHLVKGFEVVDFVPRGGRDTDQDVWLLRKPARSSGS